MLMSRPRSFNRLVSCVAALALLGVVAFVLAPGSASGTSVASVPQSTGRELVLVGNNNAGTVSFVDAHTFQRLFDFNIVPDLQQRLAAMTVAERISYELVKLQMGGDKFVDDIAVSPDGRTMYVSRSNLDDAAAFDIKTRQLLWRTRLEGIRADHLALSPDGSRLVISAVTAKKVHAIDTSTGRITGSFATGDFPHGMLYSPDGKRIYNGSIGNITLPDWLDGLKGSRVITIVDSQTLAVQKTINLGNKGIRPFVITPDEKFIYTQLSFEHGFVEYSLEQDRITRTVTLPKLGDGQTMPTANYPNDSAHHGLALSADGAKICDAGTVSDYVAILSRPALTVDRIIPVGDQPYWAATSVDGRYCFVSNSLSDSVSVIEYDTATEVARIPVGHYPQRLNTTTVAEDALTP
jgi:YVTN family beta-propeller protein